MKSVVMIGLDGATFALLKPLMDDGLMPFLKGVVERGVHGDMMSTRNPLTPPAWTSMTTGVSPQVHGVYDFLRPVTTREGGVYLGVNDSRHNRAETVWSMVSGRGRRATALNFYGLAPPVPIDGYVASGFVPWKHLRQAMHPPALFDTVRALPGFDYKLLGMDIGEEKKAVQGLLEDEHEEWIALQAVRDAAWTELCCHLMATDRTDLTAVVLDGPDKLQHLCWRFVAPELAGRESGEWFERVRAKALDYYRGLDGLIERLVTAAGPEANVIMTSDHGFGATTEVVYMNEWLARRGYLVWADQASADATGHLTANRMKDHLATVDWKRTLAFCPTPSSNAIYIKRDRGTGFGVKDSEYLDFCLRLKAELLEYRNPADGGQIFVDVDLNKLMGVPYVEPSPDVTVHLRDGGFVSILKSDDVVIPRPHPDGTHRPNGIFIGAGPDFRPGVQLDPIDLLDITPLILHLLGLPIPENLEGRVPTEALRADAASAPVQQGAASSVKGGAGDEREATAEEKEALIRQMKLLGYMD